MFYIGLDLERNWIQTYLLFYIDFFLEEINWIKLII